MSEPTNLQEADVLEKQIKNITKSADILRNILIDAIRGGDGPSSYDMHKPLKQVGLGHFKDNVGWIWPERDDKVWEKHTLDSLYMLYASMNPKSFPVVSSI